MRRSRPALAVAACVLSLPVSATADELTVEAKDWQIIKRASGPVNYYSVATEDHWSFIRSQYASGMKTAVLRFEIPEAGRRRVDHPEDRRPNRNVDRRGDRARV